MSGSPPRNPVLKAVALFVLGLGASAFAFYGLQRQSTFPPFIEALEFVAPSDDVTPRPAASAGHAPQRIDSTDYLLSRRLGSTLPFRLRWAAPANNRASQAVEVLAGRFFGLTLKVLDRGSTPPWDRMLVRGRPPITGRAEIAAGCGVETGTIDIGGTPYQVVGWFHPQIEVFRRSVVAFESPSLASALAGATPSAFRSVVLEGPPHSTASPPGLSSAVRIVHSRRLGLLAFLVYVAGVGASYWGGCLLTWRLVGWLARKRLPAVLRDGVVFLAGHRQRLLTLNGLFFGAATVLYVVAYRLPDLQGFGWSLGQEMVRSGGSALGWAGRAYATGSVVYAATTTLLINFFVGTLRDITVPSVFLPGIGAVIGLLRAVLWGIVLSPTTELIARKFKLVAFLEGEGYVIAMVFATQLFAALRGPRGTRLRSWASALVLNVKGLPIVAIVLAVSAVVEAIIILAIR